MIQCQSSQPSLLVGQWEAVQLTENDKILEVDLSTVGFDFLEDGRYSFNSTLNQKEAGSYFTQSNLLFTTDTLNQVSVEKKVQILHLSLDSLAIKMGPLDKVRILSLKKK